MWRNKECTQHLVEKGFLLSINLWKRPRRRWKGSIMLDSKEVVCENGSGCSWLLGMSSNRFCINIPGWNPCFSYLGVFSCNRHLLANKSCYYLINIPLKTLDLYKAYGKMWMASCCSPSYFRHFVAIMPFLNSKIIIFVILLPSDKTLLDDISSSLMHGCRCIYSEI